MMEEEQASRPQGQYTPQSKQLNKVLKEVIAAACLREDKQVKTQIGSLKEIDCNKITFNEIFSFQFVQKLSFLEKETQSHPALHKIVTGKKEDLLTTFKNQLKDTSKFKKVYEES